MYKKQTELQRQFNIGSTLCTQVCRLIDKNTDRYGEFAKIGGQYESVAFADAYKYRKELASGKQIPPFIPEQAMKYQLNSEIDECEEYYYAGARAMRNKMFQMIKQYFDDTIIPRDIEPKELAKVIRLAMLSIAATGEIKL